MSMEKGHKKIHSGKEEEYCDNPYAFLALGIIYQALLDLKTIRKKGYYVDNNQKVFENEQFFESFFRSKYCGTLCGCMDISQRDLLMKAGLEVSA